MIRRRCANASDSSLKFDPLGRSRLRVLGYRVPGNLVLSRVYDVFLCGCLIMFNIHVKS